MSESHVRFDEGPWGLKLNRNYMSEMSECNVVSNFLNFPTLPSSITFMFLRLGLSKWAFNFSICSTAKFSSGIGGACVMAGQDCI